MHRTIVAVDVEGFGDRRRTTPHRVLVRMGLYHALHRAFVQAGVSWDDCHREDRGDGVFVLASSELAKADFSEILPDALLGALLDHNRKHPLPARIRLRMVLHAGEVTYDSFGVTGAAIDHAFRLLEARELKIALNGSSSPLAIIVSDWFFEEVVRHSPESRPETYAQVRVHVKETATRGWIRLPKSPPAQRSGLAPVAPQPLAQLPAPPPVFIGRESELDRLSTLLTLPEGAPIGVVTGIGGIGKTALVLHWARLKADHFPDGRLYLNLLGFDTTAQPMSAAVAIRRLLVALGVQDETIPMDTRTISAQYRNAIARRRMLIILDNARNSAHVAPLLPHSPTCTVLITSRARLTDIASEHNARTVELDYLSETESRRLLTARIGLARTMAQPEATTKIIEHCDGLPLALTIVAAQAATQPSLPLQGVTAELDHGLRASRRRLNDALAAALSSSYKALDAMTAAGFRLLGLLPTSDIDITAASVLIGRTVPDTYRLLANLGAAHLVQPGTANRYRMHDLIRMYAAQRTTTDDSPQLITDATRRLVNYYLKAAHTRERALYPHRKPIRLTVPDATPFPAEVFDDVSTLDWFEVELPALLAIQHVAKRHGWHDVVWQLAWSLDGYLWRRGHIQHQITTWRIGLAAARCLKDKTVLALAHRLLGQAATRADLFHEATEHLQEALDLTREVADRHGEARAHYDLAIASHHQTSYALVHAHEALRLFRDLDNDVWTAEVLNTIGRLHAQSGSPAKARESCEHAMVLFTQHTNRHGLAAALANLGYIAHIEGLHDQALTHYHNAIALYEQVGVRYDQIETLRRLEQLHRAHGRDAEAEKARQQSHALASVAGR